MEFEIFNGKTVHKTPYNQYMEIINFAKSQYRQKQKDGEYFEKHHIIPKTCGGTNQKDNLVLLTAREHFNCHQLLVGMYIEKTNEWCRMANALVLFLGKRQGKSDVTAEEYEKARIEHRQAVIQWANRPENKESKSKFHKGRVKSALEIQHITESQNRPETKLAKRNLMLGRKMTQEQLEFHNKIFKDLEMKKRIREKLLYGNSPCAKSVEQYSLDNVLIAKYSSISEAINKTKILNISNVCRGKYKTAGGFIWKYATPDPCNT